MNLMLTPNPNLRLLSISGRVCQLRLQNRKANTNVSISSNPLLSSFIMAIVSTQASSAVLERSSAQLLQLFSLRRPPRLSAGPPGYLAKLSLVRPFAALAVAWRVSVTVQDRADGTLTRPASPRLALAWRWRLRQGRQHGPLGFAG